MPANRFNDQKNAGVNKLGLQPAVYTSASNAGTGVDMSEASGPIYAVMTLGVIHADTVGAVTFTESATVGGSYTAISGATALAFTGTSDGSVQVSVPFEITLPFVKVTVALTGATLSAGVAVSFHGSKISF